MQTGIYDIINKLETHQYPDNGGRPEALDSWGISFGLTEDTDVDLFDIHSLLKS